MDGKSSKAASWPKYSEHLTKLDGTVSRYNADLTGEDCDLAKNGVVPAGKFHGLHRLDPFGSIWRIFMDIHQQGSI